MAWMAEARQENLGSHWPRRIRALEKKMRKARTAIRMVRSYLDKFDMTFTVRTDPRKTGPVDGVAADPRYLDVFVPQGVRKRLAVETSRNAFAYVFEGAGAFRDASEPRAVQTDRVSEAEGIRFLLVSGQPIEEPVAWRGPIVMNTTEQLQQAYTELRAGTFIK